MSTLVLACSDTGDPPPSNNWGSDIPTVSGQNHHGGDSSNRAPVLKRVGDRQIVVGEAFSLELEAIDADDDPLTYSVFGELPSSAKFDRVKGRLDWTPSVVVAPFYLTFQVSDGMNIDRETARFSTTVSRENEAPKFVMLGDQLVKPGTQLALPIQATDPNSDPLSFEIEGDAPEGAKLESSTGLFTWNIPASLLGSTLRIGFSVSDGELSDSMDIKFVVTNGVGTPSPPEFLELGPFDAAVETALSFQVQAVDPDGQDIAYGIDGTYPVGASFDEKTGMFSWTPPLTSAGSSVLVVFSATDGTFVSFLEVNIFVFLPGPEQSCVDDLYEPNNAASAAAVISPGVVSGLSICDSQISPVDVDWYEVEAINGELVQADLNWDPNGLEMSVSVARIWPGEIKPEFVAGSVGEKGDLSAGYTVLGGESVYVVVFGEEPVKYAESYNLSVSILTPADSCEDDPLDSGPGNDTPETAVPLGLEGSEASLPNLRICPLDADWFSLYLSCGSEFTVRAFSDMSELDVDLSLHKADDPDFPVIYSLSIDNPEELTLSPVPETGDYRVKVEAYPETASGDYSLDISVGEGSGCIDDQDEPNDSFPQATPLSPNLGPTQRKICCTEDFYILPLGLDEELSVDLSFSTGTGELRLYREEQGQPVASYSGAQLSGTWVGDGTGSVYIRISGGTVDQDYSLKVDVEYPQSICDSYSCPVFEVCDASGECVSDFCFEDTPCPGGFSCIDTYCVDPCSVDQDCRMDFEYRCKSFPEGKFCGLAGEDLLGDSCYWFSDCSGGLSCMLKDQGGYCTIANCASDLECGSGSSCTLVQDNYLCARSCEEQDDCRVSEGYACLELPNISAGTSSVCAPSF